MKFLELTLENFRCYSPKAKIEFVERAGRPLLTFVGENGSGKTSIFLAIIWALYGEDAIIRYNESRPNDKQAPKNNFDLINADVLENSPRPSMRVSLFFEHDATKYFLFRSVASKRPDPGSIRDLGPEVLSLRKGSAGKEESYPQGLINDILPLDAFQFFFFDGEDVRRYSGATSDKTRDAIEQVLGLPELRQARDDLNRVERKLLNQLQSQPDLDENIRRLTDGLKSALEESKNFSATLEVKRKDLSKISAERIEAEARREKLKDIAEYNAKLQQIKREIEVTKGDLAEAEGRRNQLVKQLPYFLMKSKVRETLEYFKKTAGTDDLSLQITLVQTRMGLLDELLNPDIDECYCGTELQDIHRKHLATLRNGYNRQLGELREKASKKTIPPIDEIQYVSGRLDSIYVDFAKHERTISELRADLLDLDDKMRAIEAKIKGTNIKEAVKVQELIENLREKEGGLKKEADNLKNQIDEIEARKIKLEGSLRKSQHTMGLMSTISARQQSASNLAIAFKWIIDELSKRKKEVIIENASTFFESAAAKEGWKGVTIDDNYSIWLLNNKGRRSLPSEGYKELVALSFIFGLNKAASYKAPVVMDFVLGRLDLERQFGVASNFDDFADQVIVFFLDTEIQSEPVQRKLDSLAAARYSIIKDKTSGTSSIGVIKD